jgi:hypothetical protein
MFREVQRFWDSAWFMAMGLVLGGVLAGTGVWGMVQQLVFGIPWGDRPVSDAGMMVMGPVFIVAGVLTLLLYRWMGMITEVRADGFYYRFVPFHMVFQRIPFPAITRCEAVTYRPIMEYGGWGIRFGPSGRAYNVRGNRGVRLEMEGGRKLLFGSQDPEALARAIISLAPRAGV